MAPTMAASSGRVAIFLVTLTAIAGAVTAVSLSAQPGVAQASLAVEGRLPVPGSQTMPAYPTGNASGTVDVEIVVDVNGAVAHARVAASSDSTGAMDRASLAAMTGWRFQPPTDPRGRPQATLSLARLTFSAATASDKAGSVAVTMMPLAQLPPPTLEDSQFVGLADAKLPGYRPPRVLRNVTPRYAEDAMRAKIQGTVTMELAVLADGTVGAARVTRSLHESLDRAALIAARYWYFDPARVKIGRAHV